jgi:endoglucanase
MTRSRPSWSARLAASLIFLLLAAAFAASWPVSGRGQGLPEPLFQPRRGIGVSDPFGWIIRSPIDGSLPLAPYYIPWDGVRNHKIVQEIKAFGFDHIRLAVEPIGLLLASDAESRQILENFKVAIDDILGTGLNVVFDLHVGTPILQEWGQRSITASLTGEKFRRYDDIVKLVATFLSTYDPRRVAIELMNEPVGPCQWTGRPQWSEFQERLYASVREVAPDVTVVLAGPCWSHPESLAYIDPTKFDSNTLYTVHFYDPGVFTFQGEWNARHGPRFIRRLPYPPSQEIGQQVVAAAEQEIEHASDLDEAAKAKALAFVRQNVPEYSRTSINRDWLKQQFAPPLDWAAKYHISPQRIWVGEFGTMRDAYGLKAVALEDRLRYFEDVTAVFKEAGVGWSIWNRTGNMGVIIGDRFGSLDPRIMQALGLSRQD